MCSPPMRAGAHVSLSHQQPGSGRAMNAKSSVPAAGARYDLERSRYYGKAATGESSSLRHNSSSRPRSWFMVSSSAIMVRGGLARHPCPDRGGQDHLGAAAAVQPGTQSGRADLVVVARALPVAKGSSRISRSSCRLAARPGMPWSLNQGKTKASTSSLGSRKSFHEPAGITLRSSLGWLQAVADPPGPTRPRWPPRPDRGPRSGTCAPPQAPVGGHYRGSDRGTTWHGSRGPQSGPWCRP
jgi:hypothetical protein